MKTPVILTDRNGVISMNAVQSGIIDSKPHILYKKKDGSFSLRVDGKKMRLKTPIKIKDSIILRWGNTTNIEIEGSVIYNNPKAIGISSHKGFCRKFLESKGVPIPKTYLVGEDISQAKYPLIGRPEKHGQGKFFYICNTNNEVRDAINIGCSYFSEIYPKTREYRVHIFMGKILAVMEKPAPDNNQVQWNHSVNDKPFVVLERKDWDLNVLKIALQANLECGLDYSGVDLMSHPQDNSLPLAVICELNTSPSLSSCPYMIGKYAKAFSWLFGSDEKREHWDFSKFKKASSLAWKNYQLEPSFTINNNQQEE
jgi:glutathione synthase/RimK-type ligase-like ATP-grasp enzyme